jgi:acyl carrier protein
MPITMTDVQTTVVEALESFGAEPDEIVREAKLKDLDVDSLDLAELSQIVEDRYGVELTGADVERIKTVGDAIDTVVERAG